MTKEEKAIREFCGQNADWWPSTTQVQEMLALAQPEQEPVAWMSDQDVGFKKSEFGATPTVPLYTTPPQTWVGLTDDEILAVNMSTVTKLIDEPIVCDTDHNIIQLGKAIEAKLKHKNTRGQ